MSTTVEYILDVETQKAQSGLKKTEAQTKRTSRSLKDARKQARGLSGSFQFVGEAVGAINPQLAGLADGAMGASSALRGLGRALASGNPLIVVATGLVVAAIAAYTAYTASVRRNEESQKALQKSIDETRNELIKSNEAFDRSEQALANSAERVNNLTFEYQKLTGQISQSEAAEMKRAMRVAKFQGGVSKEFENQRRSLFEQKRSQERLLQAAKDRVEFLKKEGDFFDRNFRLTEQGRQARERVERLEVSLAATRQRSQKLREEGQRRINEQTKEFSEALEGIAKETERQKNREDAIRRAKERQTQLQGLLNNLQTQAANLSTKLLDSQISRMEPAQKINAEYEKEIASLNGIEQGIISQFNEAERVARSKRDQVLLTQIQTEKTEALSQVEALRADAEIERTRKLTGLTLKSTKISLKGIGQAVKAGTNALKRLEQARKKVDGIIDQANNDQLSSIDKINKLERDRLNTLREIGKQEGINTEEAEKAVRARAQRERQREKQAQAAQSITRAETVIRATFDAGALITAIGGAFGPVGSSIAGVANALSDLGQKDPEEIKEEFKATVEGIAKGLRVIVPLIAEVLPPILFDAVVMIVNAIVELPARIAVAIGNAIGLIFKTVLTFFQDPIGAIAEGIGKILSDFVSTILSPILSLVGIDVNSFMSGGRMTSAQGGIRFTGASRGLAMLHEGEAVIPRSGQISSSVARDAQRINQSQGGGGVTVVINSAITERSAVDALVRKIEERFQDFGQSTSPLFGGL